jgi:hypothetical protein
MIFRVLISLFLSLNALLFCNGSRCFAAEDRSSSIDQEIKRIKKEQAQIRTERQRVGEDASKDLNEFSEYRNRTAARKKSLIGETDSLKRVAASYTIKRDSLEALISGIRSKERELDLSQERFRARMAAACNRCMAVARQTPPSISSQFTGALAFLLNDCSSKCVDNIEGLRRLVQIVQNIEDASCAVQTGQGVSPVPGLRGNVDLLRIGSVCEAAVDEKGGACAVWRGVDSAFQPVWKIYTDRATVTAVREAINIRDGKTLPAFMALPYGKTNRKEEQ